MTTHTPMRVSRRIFDMWVDGKIDMETLVNSGSYGLIKLPPDVRIHKEKNVHKKMTFVSFPNMIAGDRALELMKRKNFVPASVREILTFGIHFPKEQLRNTVVALGEKIGPHGQPCFVCLTHIKKMTEQLEQSHPSQQPELVKLRCIAAEKNLPWDHCTKFLCSMREETSKKK